MNILLFFIILLVLVLVHEFGHFIVAKRSGIRVDEFGFGFPPRLFGIKKGETTYSFNLLPFGGFVKIFGENPDDESLSGPDAARSMVKKPKYIQAAVLFAGVAFNFILAWLLISSGFMAGLPTSGPVDSSLSYKEMPMLTITSVVEGAPADRAGFIAGDRIVAIDSQTGEITNPDIEVFKTTVAENAGKNILVEYERAGSRQSLVLVPEDGLVDGRAGVGVSLDVVGKVQLPVHTALAKGFLLTSRLTGETAVSLATLLRDAVLGKADLTQVTGPVGLVGVVGDAYNFGIVHLLMLTAVISINLAIINLLPFPALDGGRLLFLLIEKIKGSPITPKVANTLNTVGFFLLIALMLLVTYHDIVKLVK
ncbi:MAG: RIP metalloprotease RseP [Candidatus Pacebacteria bacterium]|jgi:regulator of sigma E protease|nr:RIP metalloprotease RseP [Candidatus Paceibacterota bacterium]